VAFSAEVGSPCTAQAFARELTGARHAMAAGAVGLGIFHGVRVAEAEPEVGEARGGGSATICQKRRTTINDEPRAALARRLRRV
jgi:hypothetical protein